MIHNGTSIEAKEKKKSFSPTVDFWLRDASLRKVRQKARERGAHSSNLFNQNNRRIVVLKTKSKWLQLSRGSEFCGKCAKPETRSDSVADRRELSAWTLAFAHFETKQRESERQTLMSERRFSRYSEWLSELRFYFIMGIFFCSREKVLLSALNELGSFFFMWRWELLDVCGSRDK